MTVLGEGQQFPKWNSSSKEYKRVLWETKGSLVLLLKDWIQLQP